MIDAKTRDNKLEQSLVTKKSAEKAEKSQSLAENEALLEATQAQLKEDKEFFEMARQSCKDKSDAWDERGRLRTEELSGINKALEILTSDEAKATFKSRRSAGGPCTADCVSHGDYWASFCALDSHGICCTVDTGLGQCAVFPPQVRFLFIFFFIDTGQKGLRCDAMQ